jgi:simple sugar transport system ATP-binding protein
MPDQPGTTPLLETRGLTKRFGDLVANDHIDLTVYAGEVHAILGENGAGKSTLMKSLYGFHQPESGEILLHGEPQVIPTPQEGRRLGIGMVFQNFTLIPAMTAMENIALFLPDMGAVMRASAIRARIAEVMDRYDLHVNLDEHVVDLAMGERQKVEILKILLGGAHVLIFDEPTSVLAPHEVEGLFRVFDRLCQDDFAVLFITHKLPEVMAVSHRITVLRGGRVAGRLLRADATERQIVTLMLGTAPPEPVHVENEAALTGTPVLRFAEVSLHDPHTGIGLKDVSFDVYAGEIVGVAGVSGNGQSELGDVTLGLRRPDAGRIELDGMDIAHRSTAAILDAGVACIPEDPLHMGAIAGMTVTENMVLGEQARYARWGGLTLDWSAAARDAQRQLSTTFLASPPPLTAYAENLSGGNLQRVVIAREVGRAPRLLIAYYPARGLDVSNAEAMRQLLLQHRSNGVAIVLISEDLDELFALSDRLLVMYHGRVVGNCAPRETDSHAVGHLMTGG